MKHGFVIKDLMDNGYWSESFKEFGGTSYMTIYGTKEAAIEYASKIFDETIYFEVVELYVNTNKKVKI